MNRTFVRILLHLLALSTFLGISVYACKEKPDYQDEFQERILIQLLIEPQPNPLTNCQNYYQSMGRCLTQSANPNGATDSVALARVFFFATQGEASLGSNLEEVCSDIINGKFFSGFTGKAKDCYLSCQKRNWDDLATNNQCTNEYAGLFSVNLESSRARSCLQKCGQVNNTNEF